MSNVMASDNGRIRQQLTHLGGAVTQDHPGCGTIGRRSPDARSGVSRGRFLSSWLFDFSMGAFRTIYVHGKSFAVTLNA